LKASGNLPSALLHEAVLFDSSSLLRLVKMMFDGFKVKARAEQDLEKGECDDLSHGTFFLDFLDFCTACTLTFVF
jgi:hypothetical protein